MTHRQRKAFCDFQLVHPECRLHGSTVYGMSTPDSDVDLCVDEIRLDGLAEAAEFGLIPFNIVSDLLHLRIRRLVLQHNNGTEMDVVGMEHYEEEKDRALLRICQNAVFKSFMKKLQQWWKGLPLEPKDGYPNTFNIFLMAIFFLQCFEDVPSWPTLVATELPPLQCYHTAEDIFGSFLSFLLDRSCHVKMDLHVGRWQKKKRGGSLQTWLLLDPCKENHNVFSNFQPKQVAEVLDMDVHPKLTSYPPYHLIYKKLLWNLNETI